MSVGKEKAGQVAILSGYAVLGWGSGGILLLAGDFNERRRLFCVHAEQFPASAIVGHPLRWRCDVLASPGQGSVPAPLGLQIGFADLARREAAVLADREQVAPAGGSGDCAPGEVRECDVIDFLQNFHSIHPSDGSMLLPSIALRSKFRTYEFALSSPRMLFLLAPLIRY